MFAAIGVRAVHPVELRHCPSDGRPLLLQKKRTPKLNFGWDFLFVSAQDIPKSEPAIGVACRSFIKVLRQSHDVLSR